MTENKQESKLIITKEEGYIISSLFRDNEMVEVDLYPSKDEDSILGNIYVGKVKNIVKNIDAAFVEISDGQICYLSLRERHHPIYTSNNMSTSKIVTGSEILVQVSKEQIKTKAPVVTTGLNFTGKYVVLVFGNPFPAVSSKIQDKKRKQELKSLLNEYVTDTYGFIARTNSEHVNNERIIQEINLLRDKFEEVKQYGIYRSRFSLIYEAQPGYITDIRDSLDESLSEIVTDDSLIHSKIEKFLNEYQPEDSHKLRFYNDDMVSLKNIYGISSKLKDLLSERVWLKSGATIIIQPTEALTVIDVNTSKAIKTNKKDPDKNYYKINMEAAKEIARQIRLRNISGIIIIDFIDMKKQEYKDALMAELDSLFRKDPIKTVLVDMTALNLVEVTRKKIRKPLHEQVEKIGSNILQNSCVNIDKSH